MLDVGTISELRRTQAYSMYKRPRPEVLIEIQPALRRTGQLLTAAYYARDGEWRCLYTCLADLETIVRRYGADDWAPAKPPASSPTSLAESSRDNLARLP